MPRSSDTARGGAESHEGPRDPALAAALEWLGRRDYAAAEIHDRICRRYGDAAAKAAVARLIELRLIDDQAYAERYARQRFQRGGYGPSRIRDELCRRGIDTATAERTVAAVVDPASERECAERLLERYLATSRREGDKGRAAAYRYLARRGFGEEVLGDLLGASEQTVP